MNLFKTQITLVLFFLVTLCSAQEVIEKSIGDFNELKVFDLINVELIESSENKAVIKGEEVGEVEFINKKGTLKIRMNPLNAFDGDKTYVTLFYKNLDLIDANEGAKISVKQTIDQYEIDLKVQEGAEIEANIDVTYVDIKAVTGGIITISGKAVNQDVAINTGGVYEGKTLESEFSDVRIQAGGEVYVNCLERLEINIKAGGDVYIYGNPRMVDEKRVLGGRVKRMD